MPNPKDPYLVPSSYQKGGKNYKEGTVNGKKYEGKLYYMRPSEKKNFNDNVTPGAQQEVADNPTPSRANPYPAATERYYQKNPNARPKYRKEGGVIDNIVKKYKKKKK
jgi:hypothetical protein